MKIISRSPDETSAAGGKFSASLVSGDVIGLSGDLGSGKTQFVKGICTAMKVKEIVNSPTFIIVNEYSGHNDEDLKIYHFDLYRLKYPEELDTIGFEEYLNSGAVVLIEWPELAEKYLGNSMKTVHFSYGLKENERIIEIFD